MSSIQDIDGIFQNTAEAIRTKSGETETFYPSDFPDKILAIPKGVEVVKADVINATSYRYAEDFSNGRSSYFEFSFEKPSDLDYTYAIPVSYRVDFSMQRRVSDYTFVKLEMDSAYISASPFGKGAIFLKNLMTSIPWHANGKVMTEYTTFKNPYAGQHGIAVYNQTKISTWTKKTYTDAVTYGWEWRDNVQSTVIGFENGIRISYNGNFDVVLRRRVNVSQESGSSPLTSGFFFPSLDGMSASDKLNYDVVPQITALVLYTNLAELPDYL